MHAARRNERLDFSKSHMTRCDCKPNCNKNLEL